MPMHLLAQLCCAQLPMKIEEDDDIEKCCALRAAELIEADIPPYSTFLGARGHAKYSGHATVMRVTPKGHAASGIRIGDAQNSAKYSSIAGDTPSRRASVGL